MSFEGFIVFNFDEVQIILLIFFLVAFVFGVMCKKPLPNPDHEDLHLCFLLSFSSYILVFNPSELIFMVWLKGSTFTNDYPVIIAPFVEKTILLHSELFGHPCWNLLTINVWVYLWTLNSAPFIYMSILMPIPYSLELYRFIVSLKWGSMCPPTTFFFINVLTLFTILGLSQFQMNSIACLFLPKKTIVTFDRNYLESIDLFGEYFHLNSITSFNSWMQDVFPLI